ncbi:DUF885 domain-containing protein [Nonomuraea endophytica]|uniref:Uncharacterized protein (DUF885 family) n=1 Tax=Nonomuraea endophytica TaxID=714136 RepID=A0A7W8AA82_9ACTN|nr:DUF885 domain-containing protein [Nonomuraea endophytica]MBB5081500.1 uncharacterized protein (DUF885 family) [Nonomuraea endophytica]
MSATELSNLADRHWAFVLDRDPLVRLRRGLPVERLPDLGPGEAGARAGHARDLLAHLDALSAEGADPDTAGFLRAEAEREIAAERHYWLVHPVTPYRCEFALYEEMVFRRHPFGTAGDVERYLTLLSSYARLVSSAAVKVAGQTARGIRVARPALAGTVGMLTALRDGGPAALRPGPGRSAALGAADRGRLDDGAERLLRDELLPAFDRLLAFFDADYHQAAPREVGWVRYAGGEEAYREFVRIETTLDTTPEALYDQGLAEIEKLTERMNDLQAGMDLPGGNGDHLARLRRDRRLYARSAADLEDRFRACVQRLDPALEPSMTYGYYEEPTAERPRGVYHYNGSQLADRPIVNAAALIYHELMPGHHLQVTRQAAETALPEVRREAQLTAYVEGWAEYASDLCWEMGMYTDPWDAYGSLYQQRMTAQRLVLDTALNLGRWGLERGRDLLRAGTILSEGQIASETLRYATDIPAQALAYRTGHLAIAEMRRHAETSLGSGFDVSDFHEVVLGAGALPLTVLRARVERWITASRPA